MMLWYGWLIDYHNIRPQVLSLDCYGSSSQGCLGAMLHDSGSINPNGVVVWVTNCLPFNSTSDTISGLINTKDVVVWVAN